MAFPICLCRGERGPQGPRGPRGVSGPAGSQGSQGEQGPSGADGISCFGQSIPEGVLITCGQDTYTVYHGEQGIQGLQGPQGLMGPAGSQGLPGADGDSCTVESIEQGAFITCGENSSLVKHGERGLEGPQGLQGLPGPQGEIGPQGPQGERGAPGLIAGGLHLFDANGQNLGTLVYTDGTDYRTYLSALNAVVGFRSFSLRVNQGAPHTAKIISSGTIRVYFDSLDCSGQLYLEAAALLSEWGLQEVYPIGALGGYYRIVPSSQLVDLNFSSLSEPIDGGCQQTGVTSLVEPFYPLEELSLPFVEPLGWPLRIGMAQ